MNPRLFVCLGMSLCAGVASAQVPVETDATAKTVHTTPDPAAYVYVSSTPKNSSVNEVFGYSAASNGTLTPVSGSPFSADVTTMAVNGKYLFGASTNNVDVDAYYIESNGALQLWEETDVMKSNPNDAGYNGPLFLDHSGQTLYEMQFEANEDNNQYSSFGVVKSDGALTYLGSDETGNWISQAATFIGNDKYAYVVGCDGDMYWEVAGFQRASNGLLGSISGFSYKLPTPKSGDFYCPAEVAADPTNHLAMVLQPVNNEKFTADGGAQIGSFTVASNGSISSTNTSADMPVSEVGTVLSINMAPSGKLVGVGGSGGLQIFNFDGANVPTKNTGLLTTASIGQIFWDNDNHLFAISQASGELFVFTITPTSHEEAAGSPHAIVGAQDVIVQPLPLQ